ncbi:FHA domain-containing protein [Aerosakkonemataceae cyanobacterium BLCC-F50]|uniref:FHA domain-containing protein n=1 Tax=Floridaenema flaviceps BLCC-F50 TaxID=3153642 RepID=A0ABV4XM59_9CYAN
MARSNGKYVLMVEDDKGRKEFVLTKPAYSIGRDPECNIRLYSQFVSRRHATLVQLPKKDGSYYYRIMDGDATGKASANGLIINGRKTSAHDLKDEDEVVFGPGVKATYYQLKPDTTVPTGPLEDPYDITLINPASFDD